MKFFKLFLLISSGLMLFGMLLFSVVVSFYSRNLPSLDALRNYEPRLVTTLYDKDDKLITEFSTEKRVALKPDEMPQTVIDAFVSAEDDEFFNHRGVNPITLLRAFIVNAQSGRKAQGGSTITQQVARAILLTPEKSYVRKIKEIILAFQMERAFNKKEIINIYLNQIFLGAGAYGIEAAAQTYFGKPAKDLSVPEAAILAGLPKAPSRDNPIVNPKAAKQRQSYVLRRMLETNRITRDEYEEYKQTPIKIFNRNLEDSGPMPYFSEHVRRYLVERYTSEKVYEGGLKVYTTVDSSAQMAAQNSIKAGLIDLDKRIGLRAPQKLLSSSEISKFLTDSHQKIVDTEFAYKVLSPEGELVPALEADASTPLKKGQVYEGVVVEKDSKSKALVVQVGNLKGLIKKEDYAWATLANPEEIYKEKIIRNPYSDYKVGHVVGVLLKALPSDLKAKNARAEFVLSQNPYVQGALLSYRLPSGELNALVGGYDFYVTKSEFNRVTQAKRQPGSAFKPIVYAAGLEAGLTPSTILVDSPMVYSDVDEQTEVEKVWKPGNYSEKFYGDTTLRNALAFSRNIPSIKLLQFLKVSNVVEFAKHLGIKSPLNADLTLSLGGSVVSLEEHLGAWGAFANQGKKLPVHFIRKVVDRDGNVLEEYQPEPELPQLIHEGNSFLMSSMLQSVVQYGTATNVQSLGRPVAGKTGTTSDYKDALFLGYTPQVLTGVWVGFDEDRPIGRNETGNRAPASIWLEYMKEVHKELPVEEFKPPASVVQIQIDAETGDVPTTKTKKRMTEYYINGSGPGQVYPQDGIPGLFISKLNSSSSPTKTTNTGPLADAPKTNHTKVITGNTVVNPNQTSPDNPDDVGTDELFRNEM